ncbi:MAG: RNA pyrophosphohydrolase [Gammaproteobacteria bacterium]|nr:RNA pyrophosphohydrolase [Gammaproteobacteria bacterium]
MSDVIDAEGFRANVGIVLMQGDTVFLGRRSGGRGWQFPQGGMRRGETLEQALYRELEEEIGVQAAQVTLVGQTERWLRYRLPPRYVRRNQQPLCTGQKQRWFLLRLNAPVSFEFTRTSEPEFDAFRWASWWEPVREVIFFKRPVYVRALTELAPLAFPRGGEPPKPEWWGQLTDVASASTISAPAD